tara:strand:+ start:3481 stop:4521 length:1041 start_codon:yes stop_codon:yes gene_type:complete
MPIALRGDSFQVTIHHQRERYRRSFKDHNEAKVWEAQAKADLVAGRQPDMGTAQRSRPDRPRTVQDLAWYVYQTEWAGTPSDEKAQINIKQVIEALGARTWVTDVDVVMIDNAKLHWKQKGNSNATVNRKLACLSKMLTKALDLQIITHKPKLTREKEPQARLRWYTDDEKQRIYGMLHHLGHSRYVGLIQVLMETGFRCGELFKLEPVDVQNNLLVVDINKSQWARSVPMTSAVRAIIHGELNKMCDGQTTIFGWTDYEKLNRIWKQVRYQLGWINDEQAVLHTCRHTFITNLVQRGAPIAQVQKLAGHKTIGMTMRYTHLGPQDLESVIGLLDSGHSNIYSLPA